MYRRLAGHLLMIVMTRFAYVVRRVIAALFYPVQYLDTQGYSGYYFKKKKNLSQYDQKNKIKVLDKFILRVKHQCELCTRAYWDFKRIDGGILGYSED